MKTNHSKFRLLLSFCLIIALLITYSAAVAASGTQIGGTSQRMTVITDPENPEDPPTEDPPIDPPATQSTAPPENPPATSQATQPPATTSKAPPASNVEPALASLSVSRGTLSPAFNSGVKSYTIKPNPGVDDVWIVAKPVAGCGINKSDFTLPPGGSYSVKVFTESKSTTYTIKVEQASEETPVITSVPAEGDVILPIESMMEMSEAAISEDAFINLPELEANSQAALGGGLITNSEPEAPPIIGEVEPASNRGGVNWFIIIAIILIVLAIGGIVYFFRNEIMAFTRRRTAYDSGDSDVVGSYDQNSQIDDGFEEYDTGNGYNAASQQDMPYYGQQQDYYAQQQYAQPQQQYAPPPAAGSYMPPVSSTYAPPVRVPQNRPPRIMNQDYAYEEGYGIESSYQAQNRRPVRMPPPPPNAAQRAALEGYTSGIHNHEIPNEEPVLASVPEKPKYALPKKPPFAVHEPEVQPKEEEGSKDIDWNDFFKDRKK